MEQVNVVWLNYFLMLYFNLNAIFKLGWVFLGNVSNFWSAYAVYPVNITKGNSNRTNLLFYGGDGFVSVTIDWTKQGNRAMKCLRQVF